MEPKFSVIIPVHNCEKYVAYAIESALSQTYPAWEVIVVDDGSTDDTPDILEAFQGKISIRTIKHSGSPAVPRNVGIQWSSGNYICFLDADDLWFRDKLMQQAEVCRRYPDVGFICSDYYSRTQQAPHRLYRQFGARKLAEHPRLEYVFDKPFSNAFKLLLSRNFVGCSSTVVIARRVIDKIGGLNPLYSHAEDYEYWFRCAKYTRFLIMSKPQVFKRLHHTNLTNNRLAMLENQKRVLLEVFTEHRDYLKEHHLMDDCFSLLALNNRSQAVYYSGIGDRRQAMKLCLQSLIFSCSPENLGFWFRASIRMLVRAIRSFGKKRDSDDDFILTGGRRRRFFTRPSSGARI